MLLAAENGHTDIVNVLLEKDAAQKEHTETAEVLGKAKKPRSRKGIGGCCGGRPS